MPQSWMPGNVLDWALGIYVALGAWSGYRRGFLAALASLGAYGVAIAVAVRYSGRALGAADAAWQLSPRLALYLHAVTGGGGDLARRLLGWLAFAVVFTVVHAIAAGVVVAVVGRTRPGGPNAWLGLVFGVAERAAVATLVLGLLAALGGAIALRPLAATIAGSHWARLLLVWTQKLPLGRWQL